MKTSLFKTVDSTKFIDEFHQVFNSHDAEAMSQLYTEGAIYNIPGAPEPLRGRKAIEQYYAAFYSGFPDMEVEFTLIMGSEDKIMVEGVTRGTHTGPLPTPEGDIPPTGHKIEIWFASILEFNSEGLISEDRTYSDSAVLMSQLGQN